jgi:hypothetical protein
MRSLEKLIESLRKSACFSSTTTRRPARAKR